MEQTNEISDWLRRLYDYAEKRRMPTRIRSDIAECIQKAGEEGVDAAGLREEIEEILQSMEHRLSLPAEQEKPAEKGEPEGVSLQEIREEIKNIALRCKRENETSAQSFETIKHKAAELAYQQMQDMTHCEAHLTELKHKHQYLSFYENIKTRYQADSFRVLKDYLDSMANNYEFMTEHIKSMLHNASGSNGMDNKRFYEEYFVQKEGIERALEAEARNADCGGNDIFEFGQQTVREIEKIVKKANAKRRWLVLLPIFIFMLFFAAREGTELYKMRQKIEVAKYEAENGQRQSSYLEQTVEKTLEELEEWENKLLDNLKNSMPIELKILIFLLILGIYERYGNAIKKRCDREMCSKSSSYLQAENARFIQNGALQEKINVTMQDLANEYERQYLGVLNTLFGGVSGNHKQKEQQEDEDAFSKMKREWQSVNCK